jgi:hypothetical protein
MSYKLPSEDSGLGEGSADDLSDADPFYKPSIRQMVNQITKADTSRSLRNDPDFKSDFKTETHENLSQRDQAVPLVVTEEACEYEAE